MQIFTQDQLHAINKGKTKQDMLRSLINEALFHNQFNSNVIISSLPGLGKSFEMQQAIKKLPHPPIQFDGDGGILAFTIDIATAVYLGGGKHQTIILDDCDMLFADQNVNTAKKMFDDTRALKYNKNFRSLKGMCTDLQFEAIESFSSQDKAGFSVPLKNTTFIVLTNRHLPSINQVEKMEPGSRKESKFIDLHAIRRRTEGETIEMDNITLWGYVANVVLNEKICEKFKPNITKKEKEQILTWLYPLWDKVTERNLSLIEKMTKEMVRYPKNYIDIWTNKYVEA